MKKFLILWLGELISGIGLLYVLWNIHSGTQSMLPIIAGVAFLRQTLGGVITQIRQAERAVFAIGICLTALITVLFMKLRMAKEAAALAVKRAIGIPFRSVIKQELYPMVFAGSAACACGVLLAESFGDDLISGMFGILGLGLKKIVFSEAFTAQFFAAPAALLLTLSAVTVSICFGVKRINTADHINE